MKNLQTISKVHLPSTKNPELYYTPAKFLRNFKGSFTKPVDEIGRAAGVLAGFVSEWFGATR
jgi:hypothetical protein